ncbi:hypothetical protein HDV00_000509 [Rhizophlyctis rosea]|nr:hypothetical protein HDV00_000509 [Rhizophlyctis rosea]
MPATSPYTDQSADEELLDKRQRNSAASARFRRKKKQKEQMLQQSLQQLTVKAMLLERQVKEYEIELKARRQLQLPNDGGNVNKRKLDMILSASSATRLVEEGRGEGVGGEGNGRGRAKGEGEGEMGRGWGEGEVGRGGGEGAGGMPPQPDPRDEQILHLTAQLQTLTAETGTLQKTTTHHIQTLETQLRTLMQENELLKRNTSHRPTNRDPILFLTNLDLTYLAPLLQSHLPNLSAVQFNNLIIEYRRFLLLKYHYRDNQGVILTPPPALDRVWQCHVLHTERYRAMCEDVGMRFEYCPDEVGEGGMGKLRNTLEVYREYFKVEPGDIWVGESVGLEGRSLEGRGGMSSGGMSSQRDGRWSAWESTERDGSMGARTNVKEDRMTPLSGMAGFAPQSSSSPSPVAKRQKRDCLNDTVAGDDTKEQRFESNTPSTDVRPLPRMSTRSTSNTTTPHLSDANTEDTNVLPILPPSVSHEVCADLSTWTPRELETQRRLVIVNPHMEDKAQRYSFTPAREGTVGQGKIVVSCILWKRGGGVAGCYVTGFDIFRIIEGLLQRTFDISERNALRRNFENLHPITVYKHKGGEMSDFYNLIMDFPDPKPRSISKDLKVFGWDMLPVALNKILARYRG